MNAPRKGLKVYRWRIIRSQIKHQGLWLWLLRQLARLRGVSS